MKYLKRFNEELRSQTYKSASDKLSSLGHPRRSTKLSDWADQRKNLENLEKWKANVEKFGKFGKFKFNICGMPENYGYIKLLMTDEFYIRIDFDEASFEDEIQSKMSDQYIEDEPIAPEEGADDDFMDLLWDDEPELDEPSPFNEAKETQSKFPYDWKINLNLSIALIPVSEESIKKLQKIGGETSGSRSVGEELDFNNGSYWSNWVTFEIKASGEKISVSTMDISNYDETQLGYVNIDDRKSAGLFKNLLIGIFSGNIKYPTGYPEGVTQGKWESISDMYDLLETTICNTSHLSSEYGLDMNHFVDALRKTPTNLIFKEIEENTTIRVKSKK